MADCCPTSIPSKEEVPKHVDCIIKEHKVVVFTTKDEEKSEKVVDVLKNLDVKDLDVEKCSYKDEVLKALAKKTATSTTPILFIAGEPYCGAEQALTDTCAKEKLKKRLQEACACC